MDEASLLLASMSAPLPQLPTGYQRLFATADHFSINQVIKHDSSLVQPSLPEPTCAPPIPDQSLVGTSVDLHSSSTHHSIIKDEPRESKPNESPEF